MYHLIRMMDIHNNTIFGKIRNYLKIFPGEILEYDHFLDEWKQKIFIEEPIQYNEPWRAIEFHNSIMCPFCELMTRIGYGDRAVIPTHESYLMI